MTTVEWLWNSSERSCLTMISYWNRAVFLVKFFIPLKKKSTKINFHSHQPLV